MSLYDTYNDVTSVMEKDKSGFLNLLEEHIDFGKMIPIEFYQAFHRWFGRPRKSSLESYVRFCVFQKIIGISNDKTLLTLLKICAELRSFCGFDSIPHASQITRFKQDFVVYIKKMFDNLVELTEPICREIDAKKADYLIYDPTGIEANVAENNPKFLNAKLTQAKKMSGKNPNMSVHSLAYSLMPETSKANPFVKQQYINGHFCYAHKVGILANGLGIVRDISFFDDIFKRQHPEVVSQKTDNPALDKEIGDSVSLRPVLTDFFKAHPSFSYNTFLGDSSFDSYATYTMLRDEFHFERMAIPLNKRNSGNSNAEYNENGTPVCPLDKTPMIFLGKSGGKNRSVRYKYVCHKSVPSGSKRVCLCQHPCTDSLYGKCVYTYPDKNLRLYPGIARGTAHFSNLYKHRVLIERSIGLLKDPFCGAYRKSFSPRTAKADLLFAGVTQLIGVLLANALHQRHLYKSIRKLIA